MHWRLATALALSVILVGGATWSRYSRPTQVAAVTGSFAAADTSTSTDTPIVTSTTTSATSSSQKLTDTDLISRQLFSEYVSLSANGQATQGNLDALGDKYADSITKISKAPVVQLSELEVIGHTKTELDTYASGFSAIYKKYSAAEQSVAQKGTSETDTQTAGGVSARTLASLYRQEAQALKALAVPDSLLSDHMKLVNLYLSHSWALVLLTDENADTSDVYAALYAESASGDTEKSVLNDIQNILSASNVTLSAS